MKTALSLLPVLCGMISVVDSFVVVHKSSSYYPVSSLRAHTSDNEGASSLSNDNDVSPFARGYELELLRNELRNLRESRLWAQAMNDQDRVTSLDSAIEEHEQRDPEISYATALQRIGQEQGKFYGDPKVKKRTLAKLEKGAYLARRELPRFEMEGLWVGTYGAHGEQLVNVTYRGDTMVATKVTGNAHVPRGETSFQADLRPPRNLTATGRVQHWYAGQGHMAHVDFQKAKFVDGRLCWHSAESFTFTWQATHQHYQVLFSRPTAEQVLRLMRNPLSKEDELDQMRAHLDQCLDLDVTEAIARHHARVFRHEEHPSFRRIQRLEELSKQAKIDRERSRANEASEAPNTMEGSDAEWKVWNYHWSENLWKQLWQNNNVGSFDDLQAGF